METQENLLKRWRIKKGTYTDLDYLIFKWLLTLRGRNVVVAASILKTKAKKLAENINIKGFQPPDGWLDRWENRYNVSFRKVSGEDNSSTAEMTNLNTKLMKFTMQMDLACFFVCHLTSKQILLDRRYDEPLSIYSRLVGMTI